MLTVDGGKLNMARVLSRSNRPIIIQEPQSGLDTFLTEIAKYASPEYQQQRKANERADARLELDRQEINTARQRYANQQNERARAITLEQTRYDEGKRIEDKERKYVATERLKEQITSELNSVPIASFQGDGYLDTWNSVSKSMLPNESEDEYGLIDIGSDFAKNIYNKKKIVSDNAYTQAKIYKPLFPELTINQLAKSMVSGDSIDLISDKIDKQGKLNDVQKSKLKGFNSSIKENLAIISTAQETLNELDPEKDEALFNSVSSSINTYRDDINAINKQIESIYSSAGQGGFTVPGDNKDFSGANLDIGVGTPETLTDNRTSLEALDDSFADELAFLEDDNIFITEEQEGQQLADSIDEVLNNSKSVKDEDVPFIDFDNPFPPYDFAIQSDTVDDSFGRKEPTYSSTYEDKSKTIPAISKQEFLSAVNSGEIKTEEEAREKIFGKGVELPLFVPEILKARAGKIPAFDNNESKAPIPDRFLYPPELVNPLQQSQVVEPPMDKDEEKRIKSVERKQKLTEADEFNFKSRQIINTKSGKPINIDGAVSLVSKNLNKINKLKNNYNKSEGNKKLILAKGITKEQIKIKELINDYITSDATFKDRKFDEDFYNKLSSKLNISSSELKKLISLNIGLNI